MLNPFFLQGSKNEQSLVQDIINEHLKIYGVEVYYLPRLFITEKTIIKEVIESQFKNAYPIEAYVDSYDGYSNQGTILSKFGIQELDDLTLIISKERWESYIFNLIKDIPNSKVKNRPKEGDLIYFPFGNKLFEIKYVEHEKPFYQLRKNYVYELRCELFRYENEIINTGINFIDDPSGYDKDGTGDDLSNRDQYATTEKLQMVGFGSTATAITSIVNGGVRSVNITNRGSGYKFPPIVAFSSAPFGGETATGIATMISGIVDLCEPSDVLSRVQGVELTNPGYGYTVSPKISFISVEGKGAEATTVIGDGVVGIITITDGGSGYTSPPSVTFMGVASIPAKAYSLINNSGSVTQIRIIDSGLNYLQSPEIKIGSPNVVVGFGTYQYNETIVGTISSVTAIVKSWNSSTKILEVSNVNGNFVSGEILIGQLSNASYSMRSKTVNNIGNAYNQNDIIQQESNKIIDFDEKNPFGTP
jgi:hypothetical protein